MKNKKFLVIVATALMVCLVAGMGAMTYSKYITSSKTENQATAAQWGFVVSANATNLFGTDYKKDGANATASVNGTGNVVVHAVSSAKIVAPGTKGSMTFSVEGTAEVLARITITITGIGSDPISEIHYSSYYPVVWTLKKNGADIDINGDGVDGTGNVGKLTDIASNFNTNNPSALINPGDNATAAGTYTLSWEWPLETATVGLNGTNRNVEDTLIGFKSFGKTWNDIKDLYVGSYLIGTTDLSTNYGAIETQMSFMLNINIEQVQE